MDKILSTHTLNFNKSIKRWKNGRGLNQKDLFCTLLFQKTLKGGNFGFFPNVEVKGEKKILYYYGEFKKVSWDSYLTWKILVQKVRKRLKC